MDNFEVTHSGTDGEDRSWNLAAASPQEALDIAASLMRGAPGTYSAWDPEDRFGMPVAELEVAVDANTRPSR